MNDSNLKYPNWQLPYSDALVELDRNVLAEKIQKAETVIRERLQAIQRNNSDGDELQALADALSNLNALKR